MADSVRHPGDERLQLYLDSGCSHEQAVELEAHLASCQLCRRRVQAWQSLFHTLDAMPEAVAGMSIRKQVVDQLQSAVEGQASIGMAVWIEAFIVAAMGLVLWLNRTPLLGFLTRIAAGASVWSSHLNDGLAWLSGTIRIRLDLADLIPIQLPDTGTLSAVYRLPSPAVLALLGAGAVVFLVLANRYLLRTTNQFTSSLPANGLAGDEGGN